MFNRSGEKLTDLTGFKGFVCEMKILSNAKVVVEANNILRIYDLNSGNCLKTIKPKVAKDELLQWCVLDNDSIVTATESLLCRWDTSNAKMITSAPVEENYGPEAIKDGWFYLHNANNTVSIWDSLGNLNNTITFDCDHDPHINVLSGNRLLVDCGHEMLIFDYQTGKLLNKIKTHITQQNDMSYDIVHINDDLMVRHDGKYLRTWNLSSGQCTCTMSGHNDEIFIVILLDSDLAVTMSYNSSDPSRLWQLSSGKLLAILPRELNTLSTAILHNGLLITVADTGIGIWKMDDIIAGGAGCYIPPPHHFADCEIESSPAGVDITEEEGNLKGWNPAKGDSPIWDVQDDFISSAYLSENYFFIAARDKFMKFDAWTGVAEGSINLSLPEFGNSFLPVNDSQVVGFSEWDEEARASFLYCYDFEMKKCIWSVKAHAKSIVTGGLLDLDMLLTTGADKMIKMWDITSG